jgi:NAD(P)-dependent dehydrogenase (short-subunit alcohol dehydrogenase family)
VAALAAYLLSDDASFVSGVDILIDGAMMPGIADLFG